MKERCGPQTLNRDHLSPRFTKVACSQGVKVTNDVREARSVFGYADVPFSILLDFALCHHLSQDLRCSRVVVSLLLSSLELLFKLLDSLRLLENLLSRHLLLFIFTKDVSLFAASLTSSFE